MPNPDKESKHAPILNTYLPATPRWIRSCSKSHRLTLLYTLLSVTDMHTADSLNFSTNAGVVRRQAREGRRRRRQVAVFYHGLATASD